MTSKMLKEFFKLESAAGILLGIAAILALVMENSPLNFFYDMILGTPVVLQFGEFIINKPLLLWINDGLMAIFFLLVGLEIKREIIQGQLSSKEQFILPAITAFGGLAVPAIIYSYINWGNEKAMSGWAIPTATDIAFAIGVITLLGKRVPETLKICLVAIAIMDDLAAIVIIALFYTENLSFVSLGFGGAAIAFLYFLNKRGVTSLTPYMLTGIFLWACVLKSGVHATLAGVVIAMFIPLKAKNKLGGSPATSLEHGLLPWVNYGVLPIFAFANAGVSLKGLSLEILMHPITLGIALGLFFGKQIGVMAVTFLTVSLKICKLPKGVSWSQYYGMSLITGIGFTMSLFIGTLAFNDVENQTAVRLGVIVGSLFSGLSGYFVLRLASNKA
ncbi:Na+/H+ antiporter NhaA [Rickettsiales bacterium]|nr:Na+/H+ antiporter NhaA [Rickettsiales bacterium]